MNLHIRPMVPDDAERISDAECAQGWRATPEKYRTRMRDRDAGKCIALVAELDGEPVGYINVYWSAEAGAFAGQNIPEIVDFGVLERCQRRGIGSALMDAAEALAATRCNRVCLGVGLHAGYGAAQRMYALRGYIPDGSGVWYRDQVCAPYGNCVNGDDLVLYLSKNLSQQHPGGDTPRLSQEEDSLWNH